MSENTNPDRARMTAEAAARLREPFPPEHVGKLPKAGMMLDFVGHAHVTDRLLEVDPEWTWEPCGVDQYGCPALVTTDSYTSLWIRLTVCGVTRIGVGTESTKSTDLHKQLISDALRNAAMRFGVALDLWARDTPPEPAKRRQSRPAQRSESTSGPADPTVQARNDGPVCASCSLALNDGSPVKKVAGAFVHAACVGD